MIVLKLLYYHEFLHIFDNKDYKESIIEQNTAKNGYLHIRLCDSNDFILKL